MKNDKKTIFGWCMYDWANSAYITTVGVALLPIYFEEGIVGSQGVGVLGHTVSATALWGFMVGGAALLVFLFAPVLGAIADYSSTKKRFLLSFAFIGSLFATLLYLCKPGDVWLAVLLYIATQVCFIGANVFYDAFLPQIASDDKLDSVSAKGFAFGYVGGSIQFGISLALVALHEKIGLEQTMAVRIAMAMTGIWWAAWTLFPLKYLQESKITSVGQGEYEKFDATNSLSIITSYFSLGINRTIATAKKVGHFKHLTLFLLAFVIYNDGIHTVTSMATIYGTGELGLSPTILMVTLLLVQVVAIVGAMIFSQLANRFGARRSVMCSLVLWSGVVIYGYFIHSALEFFVLGMVVGFVLGGTQALSRSFYGAMIPENASAEFYGFYSVFSKFSAIWGPFTFGFIKQLTGSSRLAIISIIVFFITGLILLSFVNEEKAMTEKHTYHID